MSRAYRIRVQESLRRVIRARDHVSTQLEVLEILPPEQMVQLLVEELERRGFKRNGKKLVRKDKGVTITVEPETAQVTVQAEAENQVELEGERHALLDREWGEKGTEKAKEGVRQELRKDLEKEAAQKEAELQQQITEKLEGSLADLRRELDQVVNHITAEALKKKAAQMGQIKELTEDPQSGSLTIVLEV
jgi:hypothetical protein